MPARTVEQRSSLSSPEDRLGKEDFLYRLHERQKRINSFLCVGLDPDLEKILKIPYYNRTRGFLGRKRNPEEIILDFNRKIIDATKKIACAFTLNHFYYLGHGDVLEKTVKKIREADSSIPIILDVKASGIKRDLEQLASFAFDELGVDAVTVNPYLTFDVLKPLLDFPGGKGILVWGYSSDSTAQSIAQVTLSLPLLGEKPLYLAIADKAEEYRKQHPNLCLVMGATFPEQLTGARASFNGEIFVPGFGVQGGKLESLRQCFYLKEDRITAQMTRAIDYATYDLHGEEYQDDFAEAAGAAAESWRNRINEAFAKRVSSASISPTTL